jgi:hypothetical protein
VKVAGGNESSARIIAEVARLRALGESVPAELMQRFVAAQNQDLTTGPEVGQPVPGFTLPDQSGASRTLAELAGPNGLLLVFHRSADW